MDGDPGRAVLREPALLVPLQGTFSRGGLNNDFGLKMSQILLMIAKFM